MFHDDNVESDPNHKVCDKLQIHMQPKLDGPIHETLRWAVDVILNEVIHGNKAEQGASSLRWNGLQSSSIIERGERLLSKAQKMLYDML